MSCPININSDHLLWYIYTLDTVDTRLKGPSYKDKDLEGRCRSVCTIYLKLRLNLIIPSMMEFPWLHKKLEQNPQRACRIPEF